MAKKSSLRFTQSSCFLPLLSASLYVCLPRSGHSFLVPVVSARRSPSFVSKDLSTMSSAATDIEVEDDPYIWLEDVESEASLEVCTLRITMYTSMMRIASIDI